jgi:hypothetical protein
MLLRRLSNQLNAIRRKIDIPVWHFCFLGQSVRDDGDVLANESI